MPIFSYEAKKLSGELVADLVEAENEQNAAEKIRKIGYFPLTITPANGTPSGVKAFFFSRQKKVRHKDLSMFTRRLADSLKGGLTLSRALNAIQNQNENQVLRGIIQEISESIKNGKSFSEALNDHPATFPPIYVSMVQAGERAGVLDTVLSKLADFNRSEDDIRQKTTAALVYPLTLLIVGLLSVAFLLTFVIPKFEVMLQDMGQSMPLPTQILIVLSHFLRSAWWIYMPVLVIMSVIFSKWHSSAKGKVFIAGLMLKTPILGDLIKKELVSRLLRMLGILVGNGVPLLEALMISKNSVNNTVFASEIDKICSSVKEGNGLSKPISLCGFFPSLVAEMISVGEETGKLELALARISDIYEQDTEHAIKMMMALLEPLIIVFAGVIICFIAISMLLPVFQLSSGLR